MFIDTISELSTSKNTGERYEPTVEWQTNQLLSTSPSEWLNAC